MLNLKKKPAILLRNETFPILEKNLIDTINLAGPLDINNKQLTSFLLSKILLIIFP